MSENEEKLEEIRKLAKERKVVFASQEKVNELRSLISQVLEVIGEARDNPKVNYPAAKDGGASSPDNSPLKAGLTS